MGHKVHPTGIRLGISKDWNSKWFAKKGEYGQFLVADLKVRAMLRKKLAQAGISKITIERPAKTARVTIHTARPGVVIGKRGEDIEKLKKEVSDVMGVPAHINVAEVRKPELDAQLVAESIAQQLERRIMFRRAMKRAVQSALRLGAEGIKITCGGRLGGGAADPGAIGLGTDDGLVGDGGRGQVQGQRIRPDRDDHGAGGDAGAGDALAVVEAGGGDDGDVGPGQQLGAGGGRDLVGCA